ncbi:MAG: TRAP transporter small permease [Thermovirgaceae bacterium]|nr:TRAP transporter small permease [Thermovirgaceae bacterium]
MTEPSLKSGISVWTARLERLSAWSAGAFLVLMIADILMGVFSRYFLHSSVIWTEEVARFSLVWLVMMGACGAFLHGDHMAIDFIIKRMHPSAQKVAALVRLVISFMVLGLMIVLGLNNAISMWHMQTMALNIPKTIPLLSLPVGFLLLIAAIVLTHLPKAAGIEKEVTL